MVTAVTAATAGTAVTAKTHSLGNPMQRALERIGIQSEDFAEMAGPLGVTPKETIYAQGTLKLHHYLPLTDEVYRVPVLIVTSVVNQPYILDLVPGQSMVEFLLRQGFDVYLIEWGRPRREHKDLVLEDYVLKLLPECVARVQKDSGEQQLSIIGYCLGGLLSVLYAALYSARHAPHQAALHTAQSKRALKNLVCIAAPVNADGMVSLKAWLGPNFDEEAIIDQFGNVPAEWVQNSLRALRPFGKVSGAMNLLNNMDKPDTVRSNLRMGKWETDNIPFPGAAFRQLINDFIRGNKLIKGTWDIGGQRIDLSQIRVPFLHLLAQEDHIIPYASSQQLLHMIGSKDKQEAIIKGGHVGLVAGRGAELRMWPTLNEWLAARSA